MILAIQLPKLIHFYIERRNQTDLSSYLIPKLVADVDFFEEKNERRMASIC
jgi:hypothetical protein